MPKLLIYLLSRKCHFIIKKKVSKNLTLLSNFLTLFIRYFSSFIRYFRILIGNNIQKNRKSSETRSRPTVSYYKPIKTIYSDIHQHRPMPESY